MKKKKTYLLHINKPKWSGGSYLTLLFKTPDCWHLKLQLNIVSLAPYPHRWGGAVINKSQHPADIKEAALFQHSRCPFKLFLLPAFLYELNLWMKALMTPHWADVSREHLLSSIVCVSGANVKSIGNNVVNQSIEVKLDSKIIIYLYKIVWFTWNTIYFYTLIKHTKNLLIFKAARFATGNWNSCLFESIYQAFSSFLPVSLIFALVTTATWNICYVPQ